MNEFWRVAIGILIPFFGTSLGAAVVFVFKNKVSNKLQKIFLGFAARCYVCCCNLVFNNTINRNDRSTRKNRMDICNSRNFIRNRFFINYRYLGRKNY